MPMNEYVKSTENIFIQYHDVIKSYKPKLLKHMLYTEYRVGYKGCIDFDKFKDYSDDQLLGLVARSTDINILKYLQTSDFNADLCLHDIKRNVPLLYKDSKLLDIGISLRMMLKEPYVNKIYIQIPEKDERIIADLEDLYNNKEKMMCVIGDCKTAIQQCPDKITTYILNDITLVDDLIEMDKIAYTTVLVANCGWNYKLSDDGIPILKVDNLESKMKSHVFKCATFSLSKQITY